MNSPPTRTRPRRLLDIVIAGALACMLMGAAAVLFGCARSHAGRPLAVGSADALPRSRTSHVIVVVMENAEYGEVVGSIAAPYTTSLARRYGLATRSFAITHP